MVLQEELSNQQNYYNSSFGGGELIMRDIVIEIWLKTTNSDEGNVRGSPVSLEVILHQYL